LGGGKAAGGPFSATTDLGFTGFFDPLLKSVLGMGSHPAVRQQGFGGLDRSGGS
jgi:hypothetical protein